MLGVGIFGRRQRVKVAKLDAPSPSLMSPRISKDHVGDEKIEACEIGRVPRIAKECGEIPQRDGADVGRIFRMQPVGYKIHQVLKYGATHEVYVHGFKAR